MWQDGAVKNVCVWFSNYYTVPVWWTSLQHFKLEAICLFCFGLVPHGWFLINSRQVQLMKFHFTTSYLTLLLHRWSFLKNVVSDCQNKEWLPERNAHWVRLCLWGGCVNVCFLPPEIPLPVSLCLFLTRTIGCLSHISHRTWRICTHNFYNRSAFT